MNYPALQRCCKLSWGKLIDVNFFYKRLKILHFIFDFISLKIIVNQKNFVQKLFETIGEERSDSSGHFEKLENFTCQFYLSTNWSISYSTMKGFAQISWFNLILLRWKLQLDYVKGKKNTIFYKQFDSACWYSVLILSVDIANKIKTKIVPETWIFFGKFLEQGRSFQSYSFHI